jgi:hypothetical protein
VQKENSIDNTSPIIAMPEPEIPTAPTQATTSDDDSASLPSKEKNEEVDTSTPAPESLSPEIVVTSDPEPNQYNSESFPDIPDEAMPNEEVQTCAAMPAEEVILDLPVSLPVNEVVSRPPVSPPSPIQQRKSSQKSVRFSDSEDEDEVIEEWRLYEREPDDVAVEDVDNPSVEGAPSKLVKPEDVPLPTAEDNELEKETASSEHPIPELFVSQDAPQIAVDEAPAVSSQPPSVSNEGTLSSELAPHEIPMLQADEAPRSREHDDLAPLHKVEPSIEADDVSIRIPGAYPEETPAHLTDDLTLSSKRTAEVASISTLIPDSKVLLDSVAQESEEPSQTTPTQGTDSVASGNQSVMSPTENALDEPLSAPIFNSEDITPPLPEPEPQLPTIVEPSVTEQPQILPVPQTSQLTAPEASTATPSPANDDRLTQLQPSQLNIPSQPPRYSTIDPPANANPAPISPEQTQPALNTASTNLSLSLSTMANGAISPSSTTVIVIMTGNSGTLVSLRVIKFAISAKPLTFCLAPDALRSMFGAPSPLPQTPGVPADKNIASPSAYSPLPPPLSESLRPLETRSQDLSLHPPPDGTTRIINSEPQSQNLPPAPVSRPGATTEPISTTPTPESSQDFELADDSGDHSVVVGSQKQQQSVLEPSPIITNASSGAIETIIANEDVPKLSQDEHHLIESSEGSDSEDSMADQEDEASRDHLMARVAGEDIPRLVERKNEDGHDKEAHNDSMNLVDSSDESDSEVVEVDRELPGEAAVAKEDDMYEGLATLFLDGEKEPEESRPGEEAIKMDAPEEEIIKIGQVEEKDIIVTSAPEENLNAVIGESIIGDVLSSKKGKARINV